MTAKLVFFFCSVLVAVQGQWWTPSMTPTPTPTNVPNYCAPYGQSRYQTPTWPYYYSYTCDCNSGYASVGQYSCSSTLPNTCFAQQASASPPSFSASISNNGTVPIYATLYAVLGRTSYTFTLVGKYSSSVIYASSAYNSAASCADFYAFSTRTSVAGWDTTNVGPYTIRNTTLVVSTVDVASPFNRNVAFSYPIQFILWNSVAISSSVKIQVSNPGGGTIQANLKGGIVSQNFNRNTNLYVVVYQTTTSYPAIVTNFGFNSLSVNGVPKTAVLASSTSTISYNSNLQQFTQQFTLSFTPVYCYFTGRYVFDLNVGCDATYSGECAPSTGTFSDDVVSESICDIGGGTNTLGSQILSYSDSSYSATKNTYARTDKVYFGGSVTTTGFTIASVSLREVTSTYATNGSTTVVTFRSNNVNTNAKPIANFVSSIPSSNTFRFEFIPGNTFTLLNGEQTVTVNIIVDVSYASGRRESLALQTTSTDSTTRTASIIMQQDSTPAKSSAVALCGSVSLLLALLLVL